MAYDYLSAKKITEPAEMQTPNTVNTEVQESVQANRTPTFNLTSQPNTSQETFQTEQTVQPVQTQQTTQNVAQQNVMNQVQAVQPVQNQSNVAVRIPSDLYDQTVQGYLDEFRKGQEINDYQAQINALNAIDQYRTTQGYKPIYTSNVYELTNQRVQKIKNQIRDYETDMAEAINAGDEALAQQIGQQMEAYKKAVNYGETVDNSATYLQNIEYKSTYDSVISGIVNELLTTRFTYDPSDDEALLKAQQYATNSVYESMNAKGILDSTMTAQIVTKTASELVPIYEKMAKEEFYNNLERLQSMANFVMNLEETQYSRWVDQVRLKLDYYEAQKDEIAYQWDRVNQLGYVDNEASIILGVAPGTMSPSMRQAIDEAERQANEQYNKLYSDIALAEAKADIEATLYENKKKIDAQYKTTNNGNGANLAGEESIVHTGTKANQKSAIVKNYTIGARTASQTIGDAIANSIDKDGNINDADVTEILEETFKGTATSYEETLTNISDALAKEATQMFGEINTQNKKYAIKWLGELEQKGYFDFVGGDIVGNNLLNMFEKGINKSNSNVDVIEEYNNLYDTYVQVLDRQIEDAKELDKEQLRERTFEKQSEVLAKYKAELINKYGSTKYGELEEIVNEKEQELIKLLKKKRIDW